MGFLNTVKSFMTKDKQRDQQLPMQSGDGFGDYFNSELMNHNNSGFIQKQPHTNSIAQNHLPPNQYFRPNEAYKQNQINNMKMLYQNNNTIRPARMNLNNQYNYYTNNERQYFEGDRELMSTNSSQMPPGYVEPYYNHDAAQNYSRPMQQQILPRRIQQHSSGLNYDQYWSGQQNQERYANPEFREYQNDHEGYFNDENIYVNQYHRPYQGWITNPYNQLQFNEQFNYSELAYDGKGYYHGPNSSQYFDDNQMPTNVMPPAPPSFYQNNHFAPSAQFDAPFLTSNMENKRYAYQPQLSEKQRRRRFIKEYANRLIPLEIAREIRSEKVRTLIMIIVSFLGTMTTSLFIALYFISHQQELEPIMGIHAKYIPHPFLTITFLLISLGLLFAGIFDLLRVRIETNSYLSNLIRGNHTIPHFLIDNYKKMTVRSIVLNWLAFPTYFFGGIILGVLYGFQQHSGEEFRFGFWSWGIVDDLTTAITITIIILIVTLGVHIANIVLTKKRKANIICYYGYEIVRPEELAALKKKTNRICLVIFIIFLIILTLVISIPWLIARRRKRSGEPLFGRWFNRN